ncbi:MAG: bifunctional nuclease family protein [Candidatus Rokubacteria bacterium]|nr:bifunctional nuclease family protein [Candidatus Rokubacteria bacterium]
MGGKRSIALFGLLAVVLLTGTGAKEPSPAPAPKATGPQEAEVVGVVLDQRTQQPVVVLQGKRDKRQFAMAIGIAEANGIAIPLQGVTPPRPLTHDLFLTLFGRLKVSLTRVVITDFRDDIYYAVVYLSANGSDMTLDSRPSDAIALAIRARVPILVEDRVFDKSRSSEPRSAPSPHF